MMISKWDNYICIFLCTTSSIIFLMCKFINKNRNLIFVWQDLFHKMQNLVLKKSKVSQTETVSEILDISVYQSDSKQ